MLGFYRLVYSDPGGNRNITKDTVSSVSFSVSFQDIYLTTVTCCSFVLVIKLAHGDSCKQRAGYSKYHQSYSPCV